MRVGIAGLGKMGQNHLRELQKDGNFDICALYDLKKNADFKEPFFVNLDDFLAQNLDILIISSPTNSHLDLAKICLNRVKTALIEKPLALNLAQMQTIKQIAKSHANNVAVGFSERFNPAVLKLKNELKNEKILSINIKRFSPFPSRISDVGILRDLSVHDIDLVGFLSGANITKCEISTLEKDARDVEALIKIEAKFTQNDENLALNENLASNLRGENLTRTLANLASNLSPNLSESTTNQANSPKILATLHQSWNCTKKVREISVICENAYFEADLNEFKLCKNGVLLNLEDKSPLFSEHEALLNLAKYGEMGNLASINDAIAVQSCLESA